ncbi:MAG: YdcF family protein [Chloroflexota bacterium]
MRRRTVARDLGRLLMLALAGVLLVGAYATYRIWAQGQVDEQRPADAIVVMGAAQYDGRPSPIFAARLDHAVSLYRAGIAPTLVVTGGKADGDRTTEAASARAYAIARGVPSAAILIEDRSRTTQESIRSVSTLLREKGISQAIFVSDRPHMLRVLRMAHDDGITAWGSPTPTSPIENDGAGRLDATVHELGALVAYFLAGTGG